MTELEQMSPNQRRAVDKALSALEAMAAIWTAEIRLTGMAERIAAVPSEAERAKRIAAMIEQGFIEGAYRHYLDHKDKCDAIEAARATADHRDSADAWQPIETAPRGGRNILIRFGEDGVSQAMYVPGVPHPWKFIDTNDGFTWLINSARDGEYGPSHWMPLPAATVESQRSERAADNSALEASAAICKRLAIEALDNPAVHKDSKTVVHAALLCAASEIRNLKAQGDGS